MEEIVPAPEPVRHVEQSVALEELGKAGGEDEVLQESENEQEGDGGRIATTCWIS